MNQLTRYRAPVLVQKAVHSPAARKALALAVTTGTLFLSNAYAQTSGDLTATMFTDVGTKIATYFGYAIAAVIVLVGTIVAGKSGIAFLQRMLSGAAKGS